MKTILCLLIFTALVSSCHDQGSRKRTDTKTDDSVTFNESDYAPFKASEFTEWVTVADHQMEYDSLDLKKNRVFHVEGRNHKGLSQFRMAIRPKPEGMESPRVRAWMTDRKFWDYDITYQREGYKRVSLQLYRDSSGVTRYQAVWFKFAESSDE